MPTYLEEEQALARARRLESKIEMLLKKGKAQMSRRFYRLEVRLNANNRLAIEGLGQFS